MKIERQIEQIINTYLPAISSGDESLESILARYPKFANELQPRLEAAIWLQQVRLSVATRPGFIHDSRKYLETQVESMQPHTIWQRLLRIHTPQRWLINLGTLTLLVITLAALINDLILAARLSIPGQTLYSTKLVIEDIQLALTFDRTAKTDLYIRLSGERTTEFVELVLQGDYEYLPTAAGRLESEITAALDSLEDFPFHEQDNKQSTLIKLRETLTNEIFMLNMLKWTSPPSALTGINLAIQVAQSGIFALH
jgi:hypothetical protein